MKRYLSASRIAALLAAAAAIILLAALLREGDPKESGVLAASSDAGAAKLVTAKPVGTAAKTSVSAPKPDLPDESRFVPAGESAAFQLWADPATGHFKVVSRTSGTEWYSYPDPAEWPKETITGTWRSHILSPIILESVDLGNAKSQSRTVNWYDDGGKLDDFQISADGFTVTYTFANSGFRIPVSVKLNNDHVETSIDDSRLEEKGALSLLNLKLYPLLGAEPYTGEEGYVLLPDGSGSLIRFKDHAAADKTVYRETIYGQDLAFYVDNTNRSAVRMPVFGIKSGSKAVFGLLTGGEQYAKLFAAPSGVYGHSYWATPEWQYRIKFFQNTSRSGSQGFYTYNRERFTAPERAVRYYFLEGESSDYAGMAAAYRRYLTDEKGISPIAVTQPGVPFYLDLIGGDTKQGLIKDDYMEATTTKQAGEIVRALAGKGISPVSVQYQGWQKGGYSSYGGLFPVDSRLGGNDGMKAFIAEAHRLGADVYLTADYEWNNNGRGGFWARQDGLRNLAGTVQQFRPSQERDEITYTSPLFAAKALGSDLKIYQSLGADGIVFNGGLGSSLSSDFNKNYTVDRGGALQEQQRLLEEVRKTLGGAGVTDGSFYTLGSATRFLQLSDDYSYDLFTDEAVPFAQMVLHGLVPYTSQWSNLRDEYRTGFLRSIEYGAYPSFIFTASSSDKLKRSYSAWYYSTDYKEWLDTAAEEYKEYNEALAGVQNQAITGHRTLAPGVKETTYEGGRRIVVNYNLSSYKGSGGIHVPAQDFIVLEGGAAAL
jgi:1,4-alpha-glucan branching enzyme